MKLNKKSILKEFFNLIREVVPVIIGILIALFIQNFQENKNNDAFVQTVLSSISEEMAENAEELKLKISAHEILLDTIDVQLDNPKYSIAKIINQAHGIGFVSVKNTAWKALMNSKMGLVDFNYISILTNIDESKYIMYAKMEKITDLIFNNIESTKYEDKRLLLMLIDGILNIEIELLESHESFLKLRKISPEL